MSSKRTSTRSHRSQRSDRPTSPTPTSGFKISLKLNPASTSTSVHSTQRNTTTSTPAHHYAEDNLSDLNIDDTSPPKRIHRGLPAVASNGTPTPTIRLVTRPPASSTPKIRLRLGNATHGLLSGSSTPRLSPNGSAMRPLPPQTGATPNASDPTKLGIPLDSGSIWGTRASPGDLDALSHQEKKKKKKDKKKKKKKKRKHSEESLDNGEAMPSAERFHLATAGPESRPSPSIRLTLSGRHLSQESNGSAKRPRLTSDTSLSSPSTLWSARSSQREPSAWGWPSVPEDPRSSRILSPTTPTATTAEDIHRQSKNARVRKPSRKSLETAELFAAVVGPKRGKPGLVETEGPGPIDTAFRSLSPHVSAPSVTGSDSDTSSKAHLPRAASGRKPTKPVVSNYVPIGRNLTLALTKLLDKIVKKDDYAFFLKPVDIQAIPDYLKIIKTPMDFGTMRQKIQRKEYHDISKFRDDFALVIKNAQTYNSPTTQYYRSAQKIADYGYLAIERMARRIAYAMANAPSPAESHHTEPPAAVAATAGSTEAPVPLVKPAAQLPFSSRPGVADEDDHKRAPQALNSAKAVQAQLASLLANQVEEDVDVIGNARLNLPTPLPPDFASPAMSRRNSHIESGFSTPRTDFSALMSPLEMSRTSSSTLLRSTLLNSNQESQSTSPAYTSAVHRYQDTPLWTQLPFNDDGSRDYSYLQGSLIARGMTTVDDTMVTRKRSWDSSDQCPAASEWFLANNDLDDTLLSVWCQDPPVIKRQRIVEQSYSPAGPLDYGVFAQLSQPSASQRSYSTNGSHSAPPAATAVVQDAGRGLVARLYGDEVGAAYVQSLLIFAEGCGDEVQRYIAARVNQLTGNTQNLLDQVWQIMQEASDCLSHEPAKDSTTESNAPAETASTPASPTRQLPNWVALSHGLPEAVLQRYASGASAITTVYGTINVAEEINRQLLAPRRRVVHQLIQHVWAGSLDIRNVAPSNAIELAQALVQAWTQCSLPHFVPYSEAGSGTDYRVGEFIRTLLQTQPGLKKSVVHALSAGQAGKALEQNYALISRYCESHGVSIKQAANGDETPIPLATALQNNLLYLFMQAPAVSLEPVTAATLKVVRAVVTSWKSQTQADQRTSQQPSVVNDLAQGDSANASATDATTEERDQPLLPRPDGITTTTTQPDKAASLLRDCEKLLGVAITEDFIAQLAAGILKVTQTQLKAAPKTKPISKPPITSRSPRAKGTSFRSGKSTAACPASSSAATRAVSKFLTHSMPQSPQNGASPAPSTLADAATSHVAASTATSTNYSGYSSPRLSLLEKSTAAGTMSSPTAIAITQSIAAKLAAFSASQQARSETKPELLPIAPVSPFADAELPSTNPRSRSPPNWPWVQNRRSKKGQLKQPSTPKPRAEVTPEQTDAMPSSPTASNGQTLALGSATGPSNGDALASLTPSQYSHLGANQKGELPATTPTPTPTPAHGTSAADQNANHNADISSYTLISDDDSHQHDESKALEPSSTTSSVHRETHTYMDSLSPSALSALAQSPDIMRKLQLLNGIRDQFVSVSASASPSSHLVSSPLPVASSTNSSNDSSDGSGDSGSDDAGAGAAMS
ncbi:hypothetical protein H4R34_001794 [Dimargaris verticillata]|uniref:Bromo domain-containing protein n=1 Tax=Dimargaris verticillata TaxID=2761393 RepID=A0A9W8EEN2_9FUNG|nr:hypothetical protein H4R34_001794 [Dimargaris verticillata]